MPCIYDETEWEKKQRRTKEKIKKELDRLTAMLCEVCALVDDGKLPEDIRHWYYKHQEQDRLRIAKEAREQTIRELVDEEKKRHREAMEAILN